MARTPCCSIEGVKKGAWTSNEDKKLIAYIEKHGEGGWRTLPQKAGLQRCGKSCRLRWTNYLRPDIKRGEFTLEEDQKIIELHATFGNSWSAIAKQLPKRTDNEIKNYWNTHLKRRITEMAESNSDTCSKTSSSTTAPPNSTDRNPNNNKNKSNDTNQSSQGNSTTNFISSHANVLDRPSSAMPRSASARLLNKLATGLPSSYCLDALKNGPWIQCSSTQVDGKDVMSVSDASSNESNSRRSSSFARLLLNKMARGINRPAVSLDMIKSILSKANNNKDTDTDTGTSIYDEVFDTDVANCQMWIEPSTSMSTQAAENFASETILQDVPTHIGAQNENGNGSVETLTEDFDLDFLQDWIMMDEDDNGTGVIGGGGHAGGVSSISNGGDSYSMESPMSPLIFANDFQPETLLPYEISDFFDFY